MAGHYLVERSRSAGWAWFLAAFALALLPVSLLFFRLRILDQTTLSWSLAVTGSVVAIGLLLGLYSVLSVWRTGAAGGRRAVAALLVGGVAAAPFLGGAMLLSRYPAGNFAETTGMRAEGPALAANAGLVASDDVLVGRDFQAPASTVYRAVRTALDEGGATLSDVRTPSMAPTEGPDLGAPSTGQVPIPTLRNTLSLNENEGVEDDPLARLDSDEYAIEAVAYAPVFAFPSDMTIRIVEADGTTYVDVRSISRTLTRDLGENRRLIQRFLSRLDEAMRVMEGVVPES